MYTMDIQERAAHELEESQMSRYEQSIDKSSFWTEDELMIFNEITYKRFVSFTYTQDGLI